MVTNMDESQLRTIEQIVQFLAASAEVAFTAHCGDVPRYAHCSQYDRGVLRHYLQHTIGYSRAQVTRLATRWHGNRYRAPAAPFARKYTALDIELLWRWIKPTKMSADRPSFTGGFKLAVQQLVDETVTVS